MNIVYISFTFFVLGLFVWSWREESNVFFAFSGAASIVMILLSFIMPLGNTVTEYFALPSQNCRVERTPYRVIITAQLKDETISREFLEASIVNSEIDAVQVKIPHNAWGIELTQAIKIVPGHAKQ